MTSTYLIARCGGEPQPRAERPNRMSRSRGVPVILTAACLLGAACADDTQSTLATPTSTQDDDGQPDCGDDQPWISEADIDLDAPGAPTAEEALLPFLEQWQQLFGGEIAMVGKDTATLTLDGAEIVVASTVQTNSGGFAVTGSTGCDGYEPDVLPGPPTSTASTPDTMSPQPPR